MGGVLAMMKDKGVEWPYPYKFLRQGLLLLRRWAALIQSQNLLESIELARMANLSRMKLSKDGKPGNGLPNDPSKFSFFVRVIRTLTPSLRAKRSNPEVEFSISSLKNF
jgi:hypothetical protein